MKRLARWWHRIQCWWCGYGPAKSEPAESKAGSEDTSKTKKRRRRMRKKSGERVGEHQRDILRQRNAKCIGSEPNRIRRRGRK